jgi:hypothetical protein
MVIIENLTLLNSDAILNFVLVCEVNWCVHIKFQIIFAMNWSAILALCAILAHGQKIL